MIIAFDTETTGTNINTDELLQISIVNENYDIVYESYLKPPTKKNWYQAEKVNHISYDMVKDAPSYEKERDKIKDIFDKAEEIIGYNVNFDIGIVEHNLKFNIDRNKVRDLLKEFKEETKKENVVLAHHRLGDAIDYYCPEHKITYLANAHDASCDTIATMKVANAIRDGHERNLPDLPDIDVSDFFDEI